MLSPTMPVPIETGTDEHLSRPYDHRKLISNAFNKMHDQLSIIRSRVELLDDPAAMNLVDSMEFGLLAPMRKLRLHLDIPYDWHDRKRTSGGESA